MKVFSLDQLSPKEIFIYKRASEVMMISRDQITNQPAFEFITPLTTAKDHF